MKVTYRCCPLYDFCFNLGGYACILILGIATAMSVAYFVGPLARAFLEGVLL